MGKSKIRPKAKAKAQAKRERKVEARRAERDLEGVLFVRTILPESPEGVDWRDVALHQVRLNLDELASQGADVEALTVVTIGRENPHEPGQIVVEVKSRQRVEPAEAPAAEVVEPEPTPAPRARRRPSATPGEPRALTPGAAARRDRERAMLGDDA